MQRAFRSLRVRNYRIWAGAALISNIGTWMQRTAQSWLVLTQLTHNDATAVGIVTALQFAPQIALLPLTGFAADRFERRKLLAMTQAAMGVLALGLGLLVLTAQVRLWQVDLFALLLGCATAFDSPVRQTFVAELVGEAELANAIALNSTSFNLGRMIGPAAAGMLIAAFGTGWVFLANAATFAGVVGALALLRVGELHLRARGAHVRARLGEGLRYVRGRADLMAILGMLFLIGAFGLHFPIFISTMSVTIFHAGADGYGYLMSAMAIGSIAGALLAAARATPRLGLLSASAAIFGIACAAAAFMPGYVSFAVALVAVGAAAQTFTTSANSLVQLSTEPGLRGRVMAILLAITLGGAPLGAPVVGWVADRCGPRWALGVAAAAGLAAAAVGLLHLVGRLRRKRAGSADSLASNRADETAETDG
jgi:MFS family permease